MTKLAVDIVLLPPENIMEYAIGINQELLKTNPPEIVLDKEKSMPHISLSMGVLEEEELERAKNVLKEVAQNFSPLQLTITGVTTTMHKNGFENSILDVDGKGLQELHEEVMKKCSGLLKQGIVDNVQWIENQKGDVLQIWQEWVKDFAKNAAFEKYEPHITIGAGRPGEPEKLPFIAKRLALCHLGNYCTCRKILAEVALH